MKTKPHSKDLRKGRHSQPGGIYLLTFNTELKRPWYTDFKLGRIVIRSMRQAHEDKRLESLAFVVMPDHVHWLIQLGNTVLESLMRDVKGQAGYYIKKAIRRRDGTAPKAIWQEGYHDHALRAEESVVDVARYIIMNPVRAGLVKSIRDYPLWDAKWL